MATGRPFAAEPYDANGVKLGESESAVARFLREGEDENAEGSRHASDDERHAPLRWREQERRAR